MKIWRKLLYVLGIFMILFFAWYIYWGLTPKSLVLVVTLQEVTPISPLYYIKIPREKLQSKFVFGDQDLSLWNFTLAKKRLEEAKSLRRYDLNKTSKLQLGKAIIYQQKGNIYLNKLIDRIDTNFLVQFRNDNQMMINDLSL